jgi:hypothetical protein
MLGVGCTTAVLLAGCSSAKTPSASPTSRARPTTTLSGSGPVVRTGEQRLSPLYAQGVAWVTGGWIFSGTNSLWKTDDKLKELTHVGPAIPDAWKAKGFDHVGDVDVVGKYVYAPLEQPDYAKGRQATARYDRDTLQFVDAVMLPQHENSFVTVDPETMTAYTMNHFDGNTLLRYDVAHGWKRLPPLRMSRLLHHTQGGDVYGGAVWISTDDPQRGVYRVDLVSGRVTQVARLGHAGGEGEGIDATSLPSGFLHVLCVDAKLIPVWFEHFRA